MSGKIKFFEHHENAVYFNLCQSYEEYFNTHLNKDWHRIGYNFIRIGLDKKTFALENSWCDVNTYKGFTAFHVSFIFGYSYIARPQAEKLFGDGE